MDTLRYILVYIKYYISNGKCLTMRNGDHILKRSKRGILFESGRIHSMQSVLILHLIKVTIFFMKTFITKEFHS